MFSELESGMFGMSREVLNKLTNAIPEEFGFLHFKFFKDGTAAMVEARSADRLEDTQIYGLIMPIIMQEDVVEKVKEAEKEYDKKIKRV